MSASFQPAIDARPLAPLRERSTRLRPSLRLLAACVLLIAAAGCQSVLSSFGGPRREGKNVAKGLLKRPGESAGQSAQKTRASTLPGRPTSTGVARSSVAPERQVEALVKARTVSQSGGGNSEEIPAGPALPSGSGERGAAVRLPELPADQEGIYPIDLPAALKLAGASETQTLIAAERVKEAEAAVDEARVRWLPSLQMGVGMGRHQGLVQSPDGTSTEVRTDAAFVGGGAVLSDAPGLAGPANGPPRLQAQFSLTDALFAPLAARQRAAEAKATKTTVFHFGLLQAAAGYVDLLRSQARAAVLSEAVGDADFIVDQTKRLQSVGAAALRDRLEVEAHLSLWKQRQAEAEAHRLSASADLIKVLQLDPATVLFAVDEGLASLYLCDEEQPVDALIRKGWSSRPESAAASAAKEYADALAQAESWRPWLPRLQVGYGAGMLAADSNVASARNAQREDFDVVALWEVRNLGLGTRAIQRQAQSRERAAGIEAKDLKATIASEIAKAQAEAKLGRQRRALAEQRADLLAEAWKAERNLMQEGRGSPAAARDAHDKCSLARLEYVDAVSAENAAQFRLLWAIGSQPSVQTYKGSRSINTLSRDAAKSGGGSAPREARNDDDDDPNLQ